MPHRTLSSELLHLFVSCVGANCVLLHKHYAGSACKNVSVPLGLQCLDCSAGINVLKVSATEVNPSNGEMCDSSHISSDWPV